MNTFGAAACIAAAAAVSIPANYSYGNLPPLLEFVNGTAVDSLAALAERRAEISSLLQSYLYGTFPSDPAPTIRAPTVLNSTTTNGGDYIISWVNVTYNTPVYPASTLMEIIQPAFCSPSFPCPVSTASSEHRRWLLAHAARGYVSVSFHSGDNSCNDAQCNLVDPTRCWADNYPTATFQLIARRAYYASRVLDYILTLPYVRPKQVALTGHSRNGKQTLIAVGMDPRWSTGVDSSSGSAGLGAYRSQGGDSQSETPASGWPGPWFLPSFKAYNGLEHTLPIDSHSIMGLVAPRPMLLAHAMNDGVITTWAVEQAYGEAMSLYAWLNASDALRMDYRAGDHHGYEAPERYADWYDTVFAYRHPKTCGGVCKGKGVGAGVGGTEGGSSGTYDISHWPATSNLFHSFNWSAWDAAQGYPPGQPPVPGPAATPAERVAWLLGDGPSAFPVPEPGGSYPSGSDLTYIDSLQDHDSQAGSSKGEVTRVNVGFGPALNGNLYFRTDMLSKAPPTSAGWPAIVFIHAVGNTNKGYVASYATDSLDICHALANASALVLCYEQVGHGIRLQEGAQFYDRWPTWSKLGKMVHDALSAAAVLLSPQLGQEGAFFPSGWPDALTGIPRVDSSKVYMAGYSIGGTVALVAAGMEARIAGVVSLSGFNPYATDLDVPSNPSGGLARWWRYWGTSPRLGWYTGGKEGSVPVDFDAVLSLVQPRPVLVYSPSQDRFNNVSAVRQLVQGMQAAGYTQLTLQTPQGINVLNEQARLSAVAWLQQQWS